MTQKYKQNHGLIRPANRLLAALIMLCLVFTTSGISISAQNTTTSGNAITDGGDNGESADTGENNGNSADNDGNDAVGDNNGGSADNSDSEATADTATVLPETETDPETAQGAPANPIHHHTGENDGTDTTTWSYVYFGSYPQGEVTDEATKAAIDSAISQGNGQPAGTEGNSEGTDVWVNGTKYRRISKTDCNHNGYFNNAENNDYRYFKWERIKWRVLQNDGNTLFCLADMAVDCKDYNDTDTSITWENCTLRNWLNNSFYRTAFTGAEQDAIVPQTVVNNDNPSYGTEGGNGTIDNIYLLSITEVTDERNGFCRAWAVDSTSRRLRTSDYANTRGTWRSNEESYQDNCWWWLRSSGNYSERAADVKFNGYISMTGYSVNHEYNGVVPVLHINLSSESWTVADDGTDIGDNVQASKASAVKITGISKKIAAGKKIQLTAEVLPENATDKAVTWTSSNTGYAVVSADGTVTTKKAGAGKSVTITATAKDGSGVKAQYKIKLMKHAVKKVKVTAPSKTVKAGKKLKLKAAVTATGKNANKKLKWISSNESYATVSASGVVKAAKAGKGKTVTITAMATDGSGKKAKIKVKIQ